MRKYWKLCWNRKKLRQFSSLGQLGRWPCHTKKLISLSRTFPSWAHVGCEQRLHCPSYVFHEPPSFLPGLQNSTEYIQNMAKKMETISVLKKKKINKK